MTLRTIVCIAALALALAWCGPAAAAPDAKTEQQVYKLIETERFDEALVIVDRQIAESERRQGPNGRDVAVWLAYKSEILEWTGDYGGAAALARRALAIVERAVGPNHLDTASALTRLAQVHVAQTRYREAEALFRRAVAILERTTDVRMTVTVLSALASVQRDLSRLDEAEATLKRALNLLEKHSLLRSSTAALAMKDLAKVYRSTGRFAEGESLARRAHAIIVEKDVPRSLATAVVAKELAANLAALGRFDEAEIYVRRFVSIVEEYAGRDGFLATQARLELCALLNKSAKYDEAGACFRRALASMDKLRGPNDHRTAIALHEYAAHLTESGQWSQAEALLKRAIAVFEKTPGPDSRDFAVATDTLASLYADMNRLAEAERLTKRSAALYERLSGANGADTMLSLRRLAEIYSRQRRHAEAIPILQRVIAARERIDADAANVADALFLLGVQYFALGSFEKAERCFVRDLSIGRKIFRSNQQDIGHTLQMLALVHEAMGKTSEAYEEARLAAEILGPQIAALASGSSRGHAFRMGTLDDVFVVRVSTTWTRSVRDRANEPRLRAEAFEAAQQIGFDQTARAIGRMASRFSAASNRLGELLRTQQRLLAVLPKIEQSLALARAAGNAARRAEIESLAKQEAAVRARLQSIDTQLRKEHPAYVDLMESQPLSVADVQRLLSADEAVVLFAETERGIFAFAVTNAGLIWSKSGMSSDALNARIASLRKQLDPDEWQGSFAPFDRAAAFALYRELWAPLERHLNGKRQVFVVTTGALTSLPLTVLVTREPGGAAGNADPQALRDTAWLIKRHAMIALPSVANLKALRQYATKGSGSEQFAGFGDPLFDGAAQSARSNRSVAGIHRGNEPDLEALRRLERLPETAKELKVLAKALGASEVSDVYLGPRATEAQVKSLDLSRKRVLAFATHGFMAGDLGAGEPGLALTPPRGATEKDNGYLSASEIADLNLRADWVILSACNTAAGDAPGAKGFSGLARAFFLAGARSILVSHWPVWDDTAPRLTGATVAAFQADPKLGRAGALRKAMLALMADKSDPRFAHPAAWAPFALAGETRAN